MADPVKITIHVCKPFVDSEECRESLALYNRAKDIEALIPLLTEDFKNMGVGHLDRSLRDRIANISQRLARNKYD